MRIRYIGPHSEGVDVPFGDTTIHMARLTPVDIDSELANSLLEQEDNFERVIAKPKKAKAPAKKSAPSKAEAEVMSSDDESSSAENDNTAGDGQED